jgi:hypothetical protein
LAFFVAFFLFALFFAAFFAIPGLTPFPVLRVNR